MSSATPAAPGPSPWARGPSPPRNRRVGHRLRVIGEPAQSQPLRSGAHRTYRDQLCGLLDDRTFQERLQLATAGRMAQLAQRLRFDLPNAFAGDREVLADPLFAWRQGLEERFRLFAEVHVDHGFDGRDRVLVLDEIAQMRIFLFADGVSREIGSCAIFMTLRTQ